MVDAENDIYEIVRVDGQLRELILGIIRDVRFAKQDIHHGKPIHWCSLADLKMV